MKAEPALHKRLAITVVAVDVALAAQADAPPLEDALLDHFTG